MSEEQGWHSHSADEAGLVRRYLWGPRGEAFTLEFSWRSAFGWGIKFGRNGEESDIGLDVFAGKLGSLWLRAKAPWLKWARVSNDAPTPERYFPRHTGIQIGNVYWVSLWLDSPDGHSSKRKRCWELSSYDVWGRTRLEKEVLDEGDCLIALPEGAYRATWEQRRLTTSYVRWPGTLREPTIKTWVAIDIEGGIPIFGKGESPWNTGMDGLYGTGGRTVEDAIGNVVSAVMRDRALYGGPHELPRPMTVLEAAELDRAGGGLW